MTEASIIHYTDLYVKVGQSFVPLVGGSAYLARGLHPTAAQSVFADHERDPDYPHVWRRIGELKLDDSHARLAWDALHVHATHGYEPGDCHCDDCARIVQFLVWLWGLTGEDMNYNGVTSPANAVQDRAKELGWHTR